MKYKVILGASLMCGVLGCSKEASVRQAETVEATSAVSSPTAPSRDEIQTHICASESRPCKLTDLQPAQDATNSWFVAEVAYAQNPDANGAWKSPQHDLELGCTPWALFAVETNGSKIVSTRKVEAICNDGYGGSGIGDDEWKVESGRLTVTRLGGSNWRWANTFVYNVTNNTLLQHDSESYFATNHKVTENQAWDFELFAGKSSWAVDVCGAESPVEHEAWSIPQLPLPDDFVKSGWRTTYLGTCATALNATGTAGFVVHGQTSTVEDTMMKIVASTSGELFVEVMDDKLVPSSTGKWIHADHLELWVSTDEPEKMNVDCVELKKGKTWQWGIDANDGTIHVAHGKPRHKLIAERVSIIGGVRFKIILPPETRAITVVYSDSDNGTSQERLLATSTFKFGNLQTMGDLSKEASKHSTCSVKEQELVSKINPMPPAP